LSMRHSLDEISDPFSSSPEQDPAKSAQASNWLHLLGEESLYIEDNILLSYDEDLSSAEQGQLHVTNFRLVLSPEARYPAVGPLALVRI